MAELDPEIEQTLADMSDQDWRALSARVRPPTSREQFKSVAAKLLQNEDQLNSFLSVANPKACVSENGDVDEAKLTGHLTTLFGASEPQQPPPATPRQWGQTSVAGGPSKRAGDDGRAALAKRRGVANDAPQFDQGIKPGDDARAALERRYGKATR